MENTGYVAAIVILSVVTSFSMTALWILLGRVTEAEDRLMELDQRVATLQGELLAHTHTEHKTTPIIPQTYPMIRYTWERRKRTRWQ